jgi:hypothetical protein
LQEGKERDGGRHLALIDQALEHTTSVSRRHYQYIDAVEVGKGFKKQIFAN